MTKKEYANLIYKVEQGLSAMDSLVAFKVRLQHADSLIAAQQKEIVRKEGVIVRTIDQRNNCFNTNENLVLQVGSLERSNAALADNVKRLGSKPKHFAIGPAIGYGYSFGGETKPAPFIGINLTYSILKF